MERKKKKDRRIRTVETGTANLISLQMEDELVLCLVVGAGKGIHFLAERGAFHGDVWYLLLAFRTLCEGEPWRPANLSLTLSNAEFFLFSKESIKAALLVYSHYKADHDLTSS